MQATTHTLADLVDLERLQRMCESFAAAGDLGLAVLDPGGAVLVSAGWQDICKDFHRVHADTLKACRESDARLGRRLSDGLHGPEAPRHVAHQCASGLWDVAFPLVIAGEHLGNLFTGQFFYDDDVVDVAAFRARAQRLGFDEAAYLEALSRVPVLAHERVAQTLGFLADFVGLLGELGLAALRREQESAARRESEARLEEAQSIARLGRWELDLVHDRLHWSQGIFALFEIDAARFGASCEAFLDAIHPDDREAVDRAYSASLESRQPYAVTHRLLMKDGRVKWVRETCRSDFDAQGRPLRSIGVVQDVTEQMRAEEALRRSEAQYRRIVETAVEGVIVLDSEARMTLVNQQMAARLGYTIAEMVGQPFAAFLDAEQLADHQAQMSIRARGEDAVYERCFRRKDGGQSWALISAKAIFDAAGAFEGSFAMLTDITARRRAEEQIRFLSSITENISDAITVSDLDFSITYVNKAGEQLHGYTLDELKGRMPDIFNAEPTSAQIQQEVYRTVESGSTYVGESLNRRKDGSTFHCEYKVMPLNDPDGRIVAYIGIQRDITERKIAEETLRESEEAYRNIFLNSQVGLFRTDMQTGLLLDANDTVSHFLGYPNRASLLAKPFSIEERYVDAHARDEMISLLQAHGELHNYEARFRKNDGSMIWMRFSAKLVREKGWMEGVSEDITERKQAEEALQRSEEGFRRIIETSPDGIAYTALDGTIQFVTARAVAMWGYDSADEILGRNTMEFVHPDYHEKALYLMTEMFNGNLTGAAEYLMVRKDGSCFYAEANANILRDVSNNPTGVLYIERDITERKQAEEALRESEEQHRSLFESMAQGVVYQDAVGSIVAANPAAERILGLSLDQMLGRTSMDPQWRAIHEDGSAFPGDRHPAMVSLRTGRKVSDVVMGVFNPTSGSFRWMTVNAAPQFRPGEGKPYRVFATFDDVTARKRAEEELREARDYLENLFGYANAPIVVWDAEQRVTRFNRAFEELTGRTAAEVVGERLELLFPEDERRAGTLELVTRASAGERWQVVEIPILHAGGEVRTVLWNSATLYADDGATPVATIAQGQDISERKRAEQALARLNEDLVDEAAALAEANATITRIAATDHLTGLANRRHFYESLEKAVSLARRHGSPLALVALDLDGLKQVNDSAGHEAGDEVLTSFAALLGALRRAEDLPARLGGDEFSVLLPGMDLGGAHGLAERVLAAVRSCAALEERGVTVSAGVAQWVPGELPDDLLRRADEALYDAKRAGGDAVAGDG